MSKALHTPRIVRVPETTRRPLPGSRTAIHDPRWPRIVAALSELRDRGRHAVRIVDADCGAGALLLHAAHHARALGFTAIEGRGIDGSPALVGRARAAAARQADAAIGLVFETADMLAALRDEADQPADILLCHATGPQACRPDMVDALHAAGRRVIGDAGLAPGLMVAS
ncbi:methyltransferase domain-containing protein [Sphingomonas ginsenosidivorax]|uniref:Methyltransferase domain-containing protein n=1 Tax=Sphingomonas ginsenosidivorax TaxID=862135 RepID=A0A5C6UEV3_9SPHN|nr:methyltransferase domain-containing protein [Sphingomonas ginsenosidivorax]TXC70751.1 methyltransferase domain-containing protein [Sphingomonas ginsenosidivorax]